MIVEHRKLSEVNVEHFLSFWSRYNTLIIEVLIGLILLTVVYLAFRLFFGGDEQAASAGGVGALPTAELEKTLQKILENQGQGGVGGGVPPEELEKLKAQIAEKEKQLQELQATAGAPGAAPAENGAADALIAEKKALEDKVKDLEARLAEYEIISEDIADLSFYKEENSKLQKELEAAKAGGGAASVETMAAAPAPAEPEPAPAVSPEPVAAPAADPLAEMAAAAEAQATAPAPAKDPLDELLAQNQPPVEPVAAASEAAPAEAAPAAETKPEEKTEAAATEAVPDDGKLMNQFADFVKKG